MDSPDQGAKDIPVTQTSFEDSILEFEVSSLGVSYSGTLNNEGVINGTFNQMGQSILLNFSKEEVEKEKQERSGERSKGWW